MKTVTDKPGKTPADEHAGTESRCAEELPPLNAKLFSRAQEGICNLWLRTPGDDDHPTQEKPSE